jgi:hypothetical protein
MRSATKAINYPRSPGIKGYKRVTSTLNSSINFNGALLEEVHSVFKYHALTSIKRALLEIQFKRGSCFDGEFVPIRSELALNEC